MSAIQAIYIRGHEERSKPKQHTVYRIEILTSVRAWKMWRRYSEFVDLHTELTKSTGLPPPGTLPPKHSFTLRRSVGFSKHDESVLEERVRGLEAYLRAMIAHKDDRWRESYAFKEFLGVPVSKAGMTPGASSSTLTGGSSPFSQFTYASWIDEHNELQSRIRDIRADINKRDALSDKGEISAAHSTNVHAKKKLAAVLTRLGVLGAGIDDLAKSGAGGGMTEGEVRRRTDMVATLQDECEKLGRMVTSLPTGAAARGGVAAASGIGAPASDAARGALFGQASSSAPPKPPTTRVFGQPPKETEQTRPLDDHGLLQLQQIKMDQQDLHVSQLSSILQRQKQLSLAIGNEIMEQNEMLDSLNSEADKFGDKMGRAKKVMNRLG